MRILDIIPTLDELRARAAAQLITIREQGDLIIANYTRTCTYDSAWDHVTVQCRGLILQLDQPWTHATKIEEVVALPFPKFFNIGEGGRFPAAPLVEVTEKLDGSLGILYRSGSEYRIATRGAFDSPQAVWATAFLHRRYPLIHALPAWLTLLFEII